MKSYPKALQSWSFALAVGLATSSSGIMGADSQTVVTHSVAAGAADNKDNLVIDPDHQAAKQKHLIIKAIEPTLESGRMGRKELPWLGVSTEEASEALASQLDLNPGVGLVVSYVASDSPAAQAGLKKNDVLVEFDNQVLVHPAQLRKLVESRKEGDAVALAFYRGGKKQTASAKLSKTAAGFGLLPDERSWQSDFRELQRQYRELPIGEAIRDQMKNVRESLSHVQIDQKKVQAEIQHSLEQARKAYEEALRNSSNADAALGPLRKALEELTRSGVSVNNNATVTVRSTGKSARSMVKTDDAGTLVIVSNPKPRLTAHDKEGKLIFDGQIETPEQRSQVPPELWRKVEPLLDKMDPKPEADQEPKHSQPSPAQ
jgi:hypothetical protein